MRKFVFTLLLALFLFSYSKAGISSLPDSTHYIYVHIIHGSRPAWGHWDEKIRLGGKLGGHVVMEVGSYVYGFNFKYGKFHVLPSKRKPSGYYEKYTQAGWQAHAAGNKVTTIRVPVSESQFQSLQTLYEQEVKQTPYDYAFFGMRCAASCYQMLSYIGVLEPANKSRCMQNAFYPRPLRKKLLHLATERGYQVTVATGKNSRIWER